MLDEDVGEGAHGRPPSASLAAGFVFGLSGRPTTSTPSRSLNEPEAATCSPAASPRSDHDLVAEHRCRSRRVAGARPAARLLVRARSRRRGRRPGPCAARSPGSPTASSGGPIGTRTRTEAPGAGPRDVPGSARAPWRCASADRRARRWRRSCAASGGRRRRSWTTSTVSPSLQARGDSLRDGEIDVHGVVDALQRRQHGALFEVLPVVDVRHADARAERRADRLARDDRLRARDLRERARRARRARDRRPSRDSGAVLARALACGRAASAASAACASCAFSSASSTETSSATSTVPCLDDLAGDERDARDGAGELVAQRDRAQRERPSRWRSWSGDARAGAPRPRSPSPSARAGWPPPVPRPRSRRLSRPRAPPRSPGPG